MIKRVLFFGKPYHLHLERAQLVAEGRGEIEGEQQRVPIEDVGFLILEHPRITLTQRLLQVLLDCNVAVVGCDERYMPSGLWMPLAGNYIQGARFRAQLSASEPLKKQLWQQTIRTKIHHQGLVIAYIGGSKKAFEHMERRVKSGDTGGEEARAARCYWPLLLGKEFRRTRTGPPPNNLLNYGYAIIRAAVARALVGAGLWPTLGIYHRNQYNAYCLADDIMEPFRPLVDLLTWKRWVREQDYSEELTQEDKRMFLEMLVTDIQDKDLKRPLMVALSYVAANLVACFEGKTRRLKYPTLLLSHEI